MRVLKIARVVKGKDGVNSGKALEVNLKVFFRGLHCGSSVDS